VKGHVAECFISYWFTWRGVWTNRKSLVRVSLHLATATRFPTSSFAWLTAMSGPFLMKFCYSEMIFCRSFMCSPLWLFSGFRWQYRPRHRCLSPSKSSNHCTFLTNKTNSMADSYRYEDGALHLSRYVVLQWEGHNSCRACALPQRPLEISWVLDRWNYRPNRSFKNWCTVHALLSLIYSLLLLFRKENKKRDSIKDKNATTVL